MRFIFSLLFVLLATNCASVQKPRRQISQGVTSESVTTQDGQRAHVATVDTRLAELAIVQAKTQSGLEKPSKIAQDTKAFVAVNGGFFGADGRPVGALKINGKWISRPTKLRGVIGFDQKHGILFDRLFATTTVAHESEDHAPALWWDSVENILGGAPLLLVGGTIIDPAPEKTISSFLEERYARTAICRCDENIIKLVVIDGGDRKANLVGPARGMTIHELASFLRTLGCVSALNLDGGYSSTYVENGRKLNRFTIDSLPEREVSTVLIVKARH